MCSRVLREANHQLRKPLRKYFVCVHPEVLHNEDLLRLFSQGDVFEDNNIEEREVQDAMNE